MTNANSIEEITGFMDTFGFHCSKSQPTTTLAMFKLTPIGLTTAWSAEWKNICACETTSTNKKTPPGSDSELFARLHGRVAVFNDRLNSSIREDDRLLESAFCEKPTTRSTEWVYGFLTAVLLDRLLWSAQVDYRVTGGTDTRPEQTPHVAQAVLHTHARRLHNIYKKWPETIFSLLKACDDADDNSAHVSPICEDNIIGSLVHGANDSRANARLATVEENFCVAALGVMGISMVSYGRTMRVERVIDST